MRFQRQHLAARWHPPQQQHKSGQHFTAQEFLHRSSHDPGRQTQQAAQLIITKPQQAMMIPHISPVIVAQLGSDPFSQGVSGKRWYDFISPLQPLSSLHLQARSVPKWRPPVHCRTDTKSATLNAAQSRTRKMRHTRVLTLSPHSIQKPATEREPHINLSQQDKLV